MKISDVIEILSRAKDSEGDIEVFMAVQPAPKSPIIIDPVEHIAVVNNELMLVTASVRTHIDNLMSKSKATSDLTEPT